MKHKPVERHTVLWLPFLSLSGIAVKKIFISESTANFWVDFEVRMWVGIAQPV
jgi:hypothetical protein